jgi:hypothetical protein
MNKMATSSSLKSAYYIIGYWIVFVVIPALLMSLIINISNDQSNVSKWIAIYIIFISPFLYFIPYLLAKPKSVFSFVFFGLIIPLIILYLSLYLIFINNFHMLGGTSAL